ncbi:transcription factor Sp8 isoform X1 [Lates japonicus]|uniref:Transcription factor Sp8 isoform X1 n=1 Tax=Lates japonicus TaxID=270547 RepID=A0AAD3MHT0_LATJO|nr:transcription factor Sp8 isoform X1 [Lates japonicus]
MLSGVHTHVFVRGLQVICPRYSGRATCDCRTARGGETGLAGSLGKGSPCHPGCGKVYRKTSHLKAREVAHRRGRCVQLALLRQRFTARRAPATPARTPGRNVSPARCATRSLCVAITGKHVKTHSAGGSAGSGSRAAEGGGQCRRRAQQRAEAPCHSPTCCATPGQQE